MSGLRPNNWNAAPCNFHLSRILNKFWSQHVSTAKHFALLILHLYTPKASHARSEVAQTLPGAKLQQHHRCQGLSVAEPWSQQVSILPTGP